MKKTDHSLSLPDRVKDRLLAHRRPIRLAAACLLLLAAGLALWLYFLPEKPAVTRLPAAARDGGSAAPDRSGAARQGDAASSDGETAYYGEYYRTPSGNKFHRKDCSFLDSAMRDGTARRLTVADYESGRYTPCSRCLPEFTPQTEAP